MENQSKNRLQIVVIDDRNKHAEKLIKSIETHCQRLKEPVATHKIVHCKDVVSKLENLRDMPHIFAFVDVALMNWHIAGEIVDGWNILGLLREKLPCARVVLYSAVKAVEDVDKALRGGAYDLVSKSSINEASTGILRVLTQFAVVERRLAEAIRIERAPTGEVDPLSHLLMKVRVGLLILGPHGKIWFQNKHNEQLNRCKGAEGGICHRSFHGWKEHVGPCPWCPSMEAMGTKQAKIRGLILPLRSADKPDKFELVCLDLASEPLWSDFEPKEGRSAGVIESSIVRTAEWERKEPVQRMLDLLCSILGFLATDRASARMNVSEISNSGLSARPVASCVFQSMRDKAPVLEENTQLWVAPNTPGWCGRPEFPGPSGGCACLSPTANGQDPFSFRDHPAGKDGVRFAGILGEEWVKNSQMSDFYRSPDARTDMHWQYSTLRASDGQPVCLIEAGITPYPHSEHADPGIASAGNMFFEHADIALYLKEIACVAEELRALRVRKESDNLPPLPDFSACRSRTDLWKTVQAAVVSLAKALDIPKSGIWWHFRELCVSISPAGRQVHTLWIPDDLLQYSRSPYVHALPSTRQVVDVPNPQEWNILRGDLEKDPDAVEGYRDREPQEHTGAWLCRVSGARRLKYGNPADNRDRLFLEVLDKAQRDKQEPREYESLASIRSYGDFPVGDNQHPIGTFHIQSTYEDLFLPEVIRYLEEIRGAIVTKIERDEALEALERLKQRLSVQRLCRKAIEGHFLEFSDLLGHILRLPATADTALVSKIEALKDEAEFLSVVQAFMDGAQPALDNTRFVECAVERMLSVCVEECRIRFESDPAHQDEDFAKTAYGPTGKTGAIVKADPRVFKAALRAFVHGAFQCAELSSEISGRDMSVHFSTEQKEDSVEVHACVGGSPGSSICELLRLIGGAHFSTEAIEQAEGEYGVGPQELSLLIELMIAMKLGKVAFHDADLRCELNEGTGRTLIVWSLIG